MRAKRLSWRLAVSFLTVAGAAVLSLGWYGVSASGRIGQDQMLHDLETHARLMQQTIARELDAGKVDDLRHACRQLAAAHNVHVTVVLPSGSIVATRDDPTPDSDQVTDAPEVIAAWDGRTGRALRSPIGSAAREAFVAIPWREGEPRSGVLRVEQSLSQFDRQWAGIRNRVVITSGGLLLLAMALTYAVGRAIRQPLEGIRRGVDQYAAGNLQHRVAAGGAWEFARLADSLQRMAAQLDARITAATRQRNEREAILASMIEGVLAVDTRQQILSINRSAAALFGVQAERCVGHSLQETVRSPQLQQLVQEVLAEQASVAGEFALYTDQERFLHVQGAVLRDAAGELIGALLVLYDVTQLKRLENVRRDFVANVSHELKTPITSIKGYVETLLDGALHDPLDAERFLRIVANQSDRLNAIIDDLLALSRVEQKAERAEIPLEIGEIRPVLQTAIEVSAAKAQECGVAIELACDPSLAARINRPLLEQAVANLIDNACKHSPPESTVWVEASREHDEVIIEIRDRGCGIEAHHLPRLFERFYRVDKSRSRKLGGTGLGLAIVKHIAQAHHGQVKVESTPNVGSRFRICLPVSVQQQELAHASRDAH